MEEKIKEGQMNHFEQIDPKRGARFFPRANPNKKK